MMRFIKVVWFLSLLTGLVVLLYVYAALPELVAYRLDELGNAIKSMNRETFFYISLAILVIVNFSLYTVSRSMRYKNPDINAIMINWQLSLAVVLNFFFMVIWNFLSLINGGENFNYDNFGFLIYLSLGLILIWIVALPVLLIRNYISS